MTFTTDDAGIPAPSDDHSLSVGPNGPLLLQDHYLIQKMAHFNRERVPERVVHAKGGGAHGFLQITEDVSQFTKAKLSRRAPRPRSSCASRPSPGRTAAPTPPVTRVASR